ncbi:hypothetical protein HY450_03280 [Candidatus Pacearchaeota archaeon]|nr:hypothetical protein [Candidatus Pacearchaeota archaeon]
MTNKNRRNRTDECISGLIPDNYESVDINRYFLESRGLLNVTKTQCKSFLESRRQISVIKMQKLRRQYE